MLVPKSNTANVEMEERYIRTITFYLNIEEEGNKRKYFNLNHENR